MPPLISSSNQSTSDKAEQILLLPGHLFFCQRIGLPPTMETGEIEEFAELSLESISPFPVEQLQWGFLHQPGAESIFVFAALRERLKTEKYADIEEYACVLPDFATLGEFEFEQSAEVLFHALDSLVLLHYEAGNPVPRALTAAPAESPDPTPEPDSTPNDADLPPDRTEISGPPPPPEAESGQQGGPSAENARNTETGESEQEAPGGPTHAEDAPGDVEEAGADSPAADNETPEIPVTDERLEELRSHLPPPPEKARFYYLRLTHSDIDVKKTPSFTHEIVEGATTDGDVSTTTRTLREDLLWQADIRSPEFKKNERRKRKLDARISWATRWVAAAAVFLLLAEALFFVGELWLEQKVERFEARRSEVRTIEDKQNLTNRLEQVSQNELRPVAILAALNDVRLNQDLTVHFNETTIEGENQITIDGVAGTINELNNYTDSLEESGPFSLLDSPETITRSGETTFSVTLNYQHPREPEPEPDPDPEAEPERDGNVKAADANPGADTGNEERKADASAEGDGA